MIFPKLTFGFEHAGGGPAQRHLARRPALHVALGVPHDFDHRLDHRQHRLPRIAQSSNQATQAVAIGRSLSTPVTRPVLQQHIEVNTLAAQVQSDVQHRPGPPFVSRGRVEFPSTGGPSSSHS